MFYWWILEALENVAIFLVDATTKVTHHGYDATCDDDFYDRISRRYSVVLLFIFTILVSTKQYVGEPIACFCPAHFTGTHVEYTNNICWISNTYFVSFDRILPKYPDPKTENYIYFYQYVPFILIIQAILFYTPSLIWSSLNSKSGYDLGMLVSHARIIDTYTSDLRETSVKNLARVIDRSLEYHKQKRNEYIHELRSLKCSSFSSLCSFFILNNHVTMRDNHLMWSFLFTKILYLFNAFGQLYLLNIFLGNDYHMYGFAVLNSLFKGKNENWTMTARFPKVTWCNFAVRNMADNIHTYTVQCSLPINLFNEKIFLIIWFWLYFTTIFTIFGFLYWVITFFYPNFYRTNLMRYLTSMKRINIHHFPQNPFHQPHHHHHHFSHHSHHHHPHHHHAYHRRQSHAFSHYGGAGSHYGSLHTGHPHHNILSSFGDRSRRSNFDLVRLSRMRDQINPTMLSATDNMDATPPSIDEPIPPTPPLPITSTIPTDDEQTMKDFISIYLGRDGILVLYILQKNTNEVITGEIVTALYDLFKTNSRIDVIE